MKLVTLSLLSFIFIAPATMMANPATATSSWTGNVQMGFTGTGGNSEDNNVSSKLNLLHKSGNWTNSYKLTALYSSSYSNVTAEKYTGNFEWLYNFKPKVFTFINNGSFYDKFNPYIISSTSAIGIGRRLVNTEKVTIDIQGGPGYRYAEVANTNVTEKDIVGYLSSVLNWNVSKTASFQETLTTDIAKGNTATKSESALSMDIVGNLGMQVSYTITHNSIIPEGSTKTKKYDYVTDVTLLFSF